MPTPNVNTVITFGVVGGTWGPEVRIDKYGIASGQPSKYAVSMQIPAAQPIVFIRFHCCLQRLVIFFRFEACQHHIFARACHHSAIPSCFALKLNVWKVSVAQLCAIMSNELYFRRSTRDLKRRQQRVHSAPAIERLWKTFQQWGRGDLCVLGNDGMLIYLPRCSFDRCGHYRKRIAFCHRAIKRMPQLHSWCLLIASCSSTEHILIFSNLIVIK